MSNPFSHDKVRNRAFVQITSLEAAQTRFCALYTCGNSSDTFLFTLHMWKLLSHISVHFTYVETAQPRFCALYKGKNF